MQAPKLMQNQHANAPAVFEKCPMPFTDMKPARTFVQELLKMAKKTG